MQQLQQMRTDGRHYIICADWNMCHKEIDLRNWRANRNKPGFLPEERAWLDRLFDEIGYVDSFRLVNQAPDQYSWWSNRGQARAKNVGWRLDYHVITPALVPAVKASSIYTDEYFSDHAPVTLELSR
jgi:exodeoxyribonuclease-3